MLSTTRKGRRGWKRRKPMWPQGYRNEGHWGGGQQGSQLCPSSSGSILALIYLASCELLIEGANEMLPSVSWISFTSWDSVLRNRMLRVPELGLILLRNLIKGSAEPQHPLQKEPSPNWPALVWEGSHLDAVPSLDVCPSSRTCLLTKASWAFHYGSLVKNEFSGNKE